MIFQNNAKLEWFETARMRPITVRLILFQTFETIAEFLQYFGKLK